MTMGLIFLNVPANYDTRLVGMEFLIINSLLCSVVVEFMYMRWYFSNKLLGTLPDHCYLKYITSQIEIKW